MSAHTRTSRKSDGTDGKGDRSEWRIGASELAKLAGLNQYSPIGSVSWLQGYTTTYLRSFGSESLLKMMGIRLTVTEEVTEEADDEQNLAKEVITEEVDETPPEPPGRLVADEQNLMKEVERLRETHEGEALVSSDARAVGIVSEERQVKAGKLQMNNRRAYGATYKLSVTDSLVIPINLFAYVDGDVEDPKKEALVELKTRQRHLFAKIPIYEQVQMAVILYCRHRGDPPGDARIELRQIHQEETSSQTFTWDELREVLRGALHEFWNMTSMSLKRMVRDLPKEDSEAFLEWIVTKI